LLARDYLGFRFLHGPFLAFVVPDLPNVEFKDLLDVITSSHLPCWPVFHVIWTSNVPCAFDTEKQKVQ
jgi:hypothetical protein